MRRRHARRDRRCPAPPRVRLCARAAASATAATAPSRSGSHPGRGVVLPDDARRARRCSPRCAARRRPGRAAGAGTARSTERGSAPPACLVEPRRRTCSATRAGPRRSASGRADAHRRRSPRRLLGRGRLCATPRGRSRLPASRCSSRAAPSRAARPIDRLVQADRPHLLVTAVAGRVRVGPCVVPGLTACLRCVDAHLADRDPRHPLVRRAARRRRPERPCRRPARPARWRWPGRCATWSRLVEGEPPDHVVGHGRPRRPDGAGDPAWRAAPALRLRLGRRRSAG